MVCLYLQPVEQPTHLFIWTQSGARHEVRLFADGSEEHWIESSSVSSSLEK